MLEKHAKNDGLDAESLAFEYVAGTLRGEERKAFKIQLLDNDTLQSLVTFWEEQLMPQHQTTAPLAPAKDSWDKIQQRIQPKSQHVESTLSWWQSWKNIGLAGLLCYSLMLTVWMGLDQVPTQTSPNANYVAVLESQDNSVLTALTSVDETQLWLQWDQDVVPDDGAVQLWALSKRDGEIRSIAVFEAKQPESYALDQAATRLIRDAEYLLLTREEAGGSAIDEPSDELIAKGRCVRLNTDTAV